MILKKIGLFGFTIRMLPIYLAYLVKVKWLKDSETIKYKEDTRYFKRGFFQLLYERPEYICILYMRLGAASKFLRYYKKSYPCFLSDSHRISGGGIYRPSSWNAYQCQQMWQRLAHQAQCDYWQ